MILKRIAIYLFGFIALLYSAGCALLVAGAIGGAGTAIWLSDKLTQEVNASYERVIDASKTAFARLKMPLEKETKKDDVAQLISSYYGKKVWLDIHKITDNACRIELRVGVTSDEQAARKILDEILRRL